MSGASRLDLQSDGETARWVVDRITNFAVDVGSLVPVGFEAYARLLHPAYRRDGRDGSPVTWAEIARANGRVIHPEMQWPHISGVWEHAGGSTPGLWDDEPEVGTLPREWVDPLIDVLAGHTSTPRDVWFCVWDGFGGLIVAGDGSAPLRTRRYRSRSWRFSRPPGRRNEHPPATVHLPQRDYHLFRGPINALGESFTHPPAWQSANLWWPHDRAWFVATEIDFSSTYVGGSAPCIDALMAVDGIEATRAAIEHGITHAADTVNPEPPDSPYRRPD